MFYSFIIKIDLGNVYQFFTFFCMSKMSLPISSLKVTDGTRKLF